MKTPFKFFALFLAFALAAGAGALRAADAADDSNPPPPPPPDHERGPGGRGQNLKMLTEKLGLTPDQQAKIKPLIEKRLEEGRALRADQSLTREQKMEKGRALRKEGAKEIEAILTPDQITKFHEMREEMREHGPKHGGDNQPPPPPPQDDNKPST